LLSVHREEQGKSALKVKEENPCLVLYLKRKERANARSFGYT
jgi:hypothetical protein